MSFFPYDPPVSDDEPEDDDLLSAFHNTDEVASLRSHRSDVAVVMPAADAVEQPVAAFLDALFAANHGVPRDQLRQQFMSWCQQQFQAATTSQPASSDLATTQEQDVARLLSWLG